MLGNSLADLTSVLRPQSDSRAGFFKGVIDYANRFMTANQLRFDRWRALAKEDQSSLCQQKKETPITNTVLATRLAELVEIEVSNFFETLQNCEAVNRGEVTDLYCRGNLSLR